MLKLSFKNSKGEEQTQFMDITKAGKFAYEMERKGIKLSWSMEKDYIVEESTIDYKQ